LPRPSLAPIAAALPESVPFTGPETLERRFGRPFLARLGANESPFGAAPSALVAMAGAAAEGWKYGDPESHDLRRALARQLGIASDTIVIGEGIDGLLGLAVRLYAAPGSTVVTSLGGYPTLNYHAAGFGARIVSVPYRDHTEDLAGLAAMARREAAAVVYLANPDNPMGSWHGAAAVAEFIAAVPEQTLILLDEAYGEFALPGTLPPLDTARPNLLRLRTFSKAHGMAGLRCGYAVGEKQTIRAFERVRNHFGVNAVAQAGASPPLPRPRIWRTSSNAPPPPEPALPPSPAPMAWRPCPRRPISSRSIPAATPPMPQPCSQPCPTSASSSASPWPPASTTASASAPVRPLRLTCWPTPYPGPWRPLPRAFPAKVAPLLRFENATDQRVGAVEPFQRNGEML